MHEEALLVKGVEGHLQRIGRTPLGGDIMAKRNDSSVYAIMVLVADVGIV